MESKLQAFGLDVEFLYSSLAQSSEDYLFIWDLKNNNFLISDKMKEDFDFPATYLENYLGAWLARIHEKDVERVRELFYHAVHTNQEKIQFEYQVLMENGKYVWMYSKAIVKYDEESKEPKILIGFLHSLEDGGDLDTITGLYTHEKCREYFEKRTIHTHQYRGCILLLGIDDFAAINTLNNHSFGDLVLRNTVQEIQKILPVGFYMYRFDGDQFVLIADEQSKVDMYQVYKLLCEYAKQHHEINNMTYQFTISAGLVSYPEDGIVWSELLKCASVALKKAKENGKNQCIFYTPAMLNEKVQEQLVGKLLSESIHQNFKGFRVVYQPVCEAKNLHVKGAEALLRFDTPDGLTLRPDEFIPILENSGLIIPVGIWVLEQAIISCLEWLKFIPGFVMNVNVSYIQLRDKEFCDKVEDLIHRYQIDTKHITLELTESYFMTDATNINSSLIRLQELHLQMAMDDFGTGYSSLARLSQFNVDIIKIDKMFVRSLQSSKYNHDFIESVVRLCHNTGMKVCVEGVETREEQKRINLLNVDFIQGFYVSKPINKNIFFETFVKVKFNSDSLVVETDKELLSKQLVGDRNLLNAMMNANPLALHLWNYDGEILACNDEALKLFEVEDEIQFRNHFFDYSLPEQEGVSSKVKAMEYIKEAFEKGRIEFHWMHKTSSNELIPSEVTFVKIPYQNDYILVSYTRDLRDQLALEENLRKSNSKIKAILDATPLCLNLWDKDMKNIMCNEEAVTLFELRNGQEYMDNFNLLSPTYQPDGSLSEESARIHVENAFKNGREQFFWMHKRLDGEEIPSEIILVKIEGLDDDGGDLVAGFTRDMRLQLQAAKVEKAANERIRAVLESSPLTCVLWTLDSEMIDCSKTTFDMFQIKSKKELMEHFDELMPEYQPDGCLSTKKRKEIMQYAIEHGYHQFEWMYQNTKGEQIPCEVTLVRIALDSDDIIVAYSRDLREIRKTLEINTRLTKMAYYDLLTGCASRAAFIDVLQQNFKQAKYGDSFALIIFDLDFFKEVNDTYGHDVGDITLKAVINKVTSLIPVNAYLGRYGGDEFMIQIKGVGEEELHEIVSNMTVEVSKIEINANGTYFHPSISLGATYWKPTDDGHDSLLKRADIALYAAKHKGRNCFVIE